jgi:peptidoglycan hydrolase-like protein with peptidoglycan-binding domain
VTAPAVATRGIGLLAGAVGQHCANNRDDVETVQRLLNLRLSASDTLLKPDGAFGEKTHAAIGAFQREALGLMEPEGKIDPRDRTLAALCQSLPGEIDEPLLALLYLRASDADIHDFVAPIRNTMAKRAINTARRQATFLLRSGTRAASCAGARSLPTARRMRDGAILVTPNRATVPVSRAAA